MAAARHLSLTATALVAKPLLLACLALLGACAAAPAGPAVALDAPVGATAAPATTATPRTAAAKPAAPAAVDAAWANVQREAALVAACSEDAQCRVIGTGHRACGGPSGYLPWSSQRSDGAVLAAAVQRHAGLAAAADQHAGRASTCAMQPEPAVACKAKRCELQQP